MINYKIEERLKGQALAPDFAAKGWRRDIQNNSFHKGDKEIYFIHPYMIFSFSGAQYVGKYCKSIHKVKIFN